MSELYTNAGDTTKLRIPCTVVGTNVPAAAKLEALPTLPFAAENEPQRPSAAGYEVLHMLGQGSTK